jgi:hypothetical protein
VPAVRWRILVPVLAVTGLLAVVTPVAAAADGPAPPPLAATPIGASSLQPARRGAVKQIGPYVPEVPPVPAGTGVGRRVVYCNSCQYVWVIDEHDKVIRN